MTQTDWDAFLQSPESVSLLCKAAASQLLVSPVLNKNAIVGNSDCTHSYEAALMTSFIRHHLIEQGISHSFETVMSHLSKLDEIRKANQKGYKTYL